MKRAIAGGLVAVMLAGCANRPGYRGTGTGWEPVVDIRPGQEATYRQDLSACQAHAGKVMQANEAALAGAIGGALIGALLGAAARGDGRFNRQMAGVGAIGGGVGAAAEAEGGVRGITRSCLMGRGYSVLN